MFSAVTKLLRGLPPALLLGLGAALEIAPIHTEWTLLAEYCDRWVYFLAPWGMQMEILHMPPGMPYERATPARRYGPCEDPWSPVPPDGPVSDGGA